MLTVCPYGSKYYMILTTSYCTHIKEVEYNCSCKNSNKTGYLCSHVLAIYHMQDKISLNSLANKIINKASQGGRPRKRIAALDRE